MTIIIFIFILFVLILVHEFGHFIVAKKSGIRVDEFGIGFPPKAATLFKKNGTEYTINWLPFGGFVKIYGENYEDLEEGQKLSKDSFTAKSKWTQVFVLVAGVLMNFLLAWLLISFSFLSGVPASTSSGVNVKDPVLTVISVDKDSVAQLAGLQVGDKILSVTDDGVVSSLPTPEVFQSIVRSNTNTDISLRVIHENKEIDLVVTPTKSADKDFPSIGISMDFIGIEKIPLNRAFIEGFKSSVSFAKSIVVGFFGIFTGSTDLSTLSGPVGIAGVVGQASKTGFTELMLLTAIISLNLAVLNLIPFPALDGGRIVFVGIEALMGKPIPVKIFSIINTVGFFLLIGLMILVSVRDVLNLF